MACPSDSSGTALSPRNSGAPGLVPPSSPTRRTTNGCLRRGVTAGGNYAAVVPDRHVTYKWHRTVLRKEIDPGTTVVAKGRICAPDGWSRMIEPPFGPIPATSTLPSAMAVIEVAWVMEAAITASPVKVGSGAPFRASVRRSRAHHHCRRRVAAVRNQVQRFAGHWKPSRRQDSSGSCAAKSGVR